MPGHDVYLVGSVPMADAEAVFETVSAALGPRIKRIPDGETGERGDWITWLEPVFAAIRRSRNPASSSACTRAAPAGSATRCRPGFAPQDVRFDNLFYADIAQASYAVFKRLKDAGKIAPARPSSRSTWCRRIR